MYVKITTSNCTYTVQRNIECIPLKDNISFSRIQDSCDGTVFREQYNYIYGNTLHSPQDVYIPTDNNFQNLYWLRKDFLEYYEECLYSSQLSNIQDQFGVGTNSDFFNSLKNDTINIKDYIPVEICWSDSNIYPFKYGETKYGWFPHKRPYSLACYHVTNDEYDLPKLAEFLQKEEELGNVGIYRKDGDILHSIPYYNRDGKATHYLNFYPLVESAEEYVEMDKDFLGLHINPKWEKLIELYKI